MMIIHHGTESDIQIDPQTRHNEEPQKYHTRKHETLGENVETHLDRQKSSYTLFYKSFEDSLTLVQDSRVIERPAAILDPYEVDL